jgi:mannose-1-phosphate guanylyltransferase
MEFIVPVILSGGAGSRLWPVSRELHPKPFIKMDNGESLLQKTFIRAAELNNISEVVTVTNRDLLFKTEDDYELVNDKQLPTSYILEPFGRNTAPAIAIAARKVKEKHGDNAILLVLSADHLIEDQTAFEQAVNSAIKLAESEYLVTFGIKPTFPETGYGYIQSQHDAINDDDSCFKVKQFVEKPSYDVAVEYCDSGEYFWNSGIFCFKAATVLAELDKHAPELMESVHESLKTAKTGDSNSIRLKENQFQHVPDISIDYALMEKSDKVAMVACDIGWSDIGSWKAISELNETEQDGNFISGDAILHDVTNCYIRNEGRMLGAIGVDNLVIVDTHDALLIADKSRSQDVKKIVSELKQKGLDLHKTHREVHRPWGTYTVLEEEKHCKIKRIVVKPGASLSLQMHLHRNEHWIVVNGIAKVHNNGETFLLNKNESTYILAGNKHRLENPGVVNLVLIEVQTGEYLGEDDIQRFDDKYGRSPE